MLKELTLLGKYDPRMDFCARASIRNLRPGRDPRVTDPPKNRSIADLSERGSVGIWSHWIFDGKDFEFFEALPRAQVYKQLDIPKASDLPVVHF